MLEELQQKSKKPQKLQSIKAWAIRLKKEVMTVYLACKRRDTPWYARLLGIVVVGYALSPIDLIPDFIPVLGYLDDLLLIPLGVWLTIRLIPKNIMDECRVQAEEAFKGSKPESRIAAVIIILIWAVVIGFIIYKLLS
jgi:uncharacterized membrane protein YkvA (DUF1232 family)